MTVIDLFAGAGGWAVALRDLGLDSHGFELNTVAAHTSNRAGHRVEVFDVRKLPDALSGCDALVGSPPCQSFSCAGKGKGHQDMVQIIEDVRERRFTRSDWNAEGASLVLEPLRLALANRPEWVALEQVKEVLPIWRAMALVLREEGYDVWVGTLNATQVGLCQNRQRAVLMARRTTGPVQPRPPVRHPHPFRHLVGVEYRDGMKALNQPSHSVTTGGGRDSGIGIMASKAYRKKLSWDVRNVLNPEERRPWFRLSNSPDAVFLHLRTATMLQGFPPDYPWQGTKAQQFTQVGNAIPPPMAKLIVSTLLEQA